LKLILDCGSIIWLRACPVESGACTQNGEGVPRENHRLYTRQFNYSRRALCAGSFHIPDQRHRLSWRPNEQRASVAAFYMINIDLRLLAVVRELNRTRSVSSTAKRLGLSQSAVSMSLAKMRDHFRDQLFVRTSGGLVSTPHGTEIFDQLKKAEEILRNVLEHEVVFKPATADRVFHIHATDIAQVTLLPKLIMRLRDIGPSVRIDLQRISENTPRLLESGGADLAVGFIQSMGAGFCQQRLFKEKFVCAVRGDHPRVRDDLTLAQFQSEGHLAVETFGTGHGIVGMALAEQKIERKIVLTVPSSLGISSILGSADVLAILPEQLGDYLASIGNIKTFPLPFAMPTYFIVQHWHELNGHDPANKWLRGVMASLFLKPEKRTDSTEKALSPMPLVLSARECRQAAAQKA
jgi:DNA-binding transcriptional LysR family regulator